MMNTTPNVDETTGDYKKCPICGNELYWTIDFKKCTCKDRGCNFQNINYENYSNKFFYLN